MAYTILQEENITEQIIPSGIQRPRYRKVFEKEFEPGDVIRLDGWVNGQKKELCEYTVDAALPSGVVIRGVVTVDFVQSN